MKGRKPIPSALKKLAGNPGKRPILEDLAAPSSAPDRPRGLSVEARKEWDRITSELAHLGILSCVDRSALELYCATWERWKGSEAAIKQEGAVVDGRANPHVSMANKALMIMKSFLAEFGLTPSSRARLHVSEKQEVDDDDPLAQIARLTAQQNTTRLTDAPV